MSIVLGKYLKRYFLIIKKYKKYKKKRIVKNYIKKDSIKVAVGSTNPTKIEAVRQAFTIMLPEQVCEFIGISTDSGVSAQPMHDEESIQGARTRAHSAIKSMNADFGVGIEGGLQKINNRWFDCSWTVITDTRGTEGIGSSVKIIVPEKVMALIHEGHELGTALDKIFNRVNVKHAEGHLGLMTKNAITRTTAARDGVIVALAHFLQE